MFTCSQDREISHQHAAIANRWAGSECQLDGVEAKITGRLCRFATISPLNPHRNPIETTWPVVAAIMASTKQFYS